MLTILMRTAILYVVVIIALRLMGKKQLGELQPSELVTTILISNIATVSIEDLSLPLLSGIIPIIIIVCLDVIMSMITLKSEFIRKSVTGSPRIIISNGSIDQKEMAQLRYTLDDLLEAMRDAGEFDLSKIQFAIAETTGKINFFPSPSPPEMPEDPPFVIISDGKISNENLKRTNLGNKWLQQTLANYGVEPKEVFLLTVKISGETYLIKREKGRRK